MARGRPGASGCNIRGAEEVSHCGEVDLRYLRGLARWVDVRPRGGRAMAHLQITPLHPVIDGRALWRNIVEGDLPRVA